MKMSFAQTIAVVVIVGQPVMNPIHIHFLYHRKFLYHWKFSTASTHRHKKWFIEAVGNMSCLYKSFSKKMENSQKK